MQPLQRLLLDRLHEHRTNLSAAHRLEQRGRVGPIGLVATNVGAHILRRKQRDADATPLEPPPPVMRRRTGFHDHVRDAAGRKEALELHPGEPPPLGNTPGPIRHRDLEYALRQVNRHGCRVHLAFLRSWGALKGPYKPNQRTVPPLRGDLIPTFPSKCSESAPKPPPSP